ncbi:class I SAM-dependent methyltransferase [Thiothrix subterranea]|uniref:Histidine kinase n=1 Tax=Thiothrix subterranea TaxID=2735563 RepID=A0AA51MS52_9GAMM|nr:methyltransferase domain-containing protein [Thiothrix subterranea]MDQ5770162.1 histidine kinase [Thiothrix subterranea]WML88904.1 histidine kinase [Thiothrix subterranea]
MMPLPLPLRVRYQTVEFGKTDIHLCTLRDKQEFSDPDQVAHDLGIFSAQWSLFGVVWPSSLVLAHYVCDYQTDGKRILEVGCGMALSSLLLNHQHADITATDYHPEVAFFLQRNTLLNHGAVIPFEQADWAAETHTLGQFDLIIGSDLFYEDQHIKQLAGFIEKCAKPTCEVILIDPGRGRKNKLGLQMEGYGFASSQRKPIHTDYLEQPFKGHILTFRRDV